jgi:hypothetical protein
MDVFWASGIGDPCLKGDLSVTIYDAILKFSVTDPALLWRAAARRLEHSGLEPGDVNATIGFADDPQIEECLTALILPLSIEGGQLIDYEVQPDIGTTAIAGAEEALSALYS